MRVRDDLVVLRAHQAVEARRAAEEALADLRRRLRLVLDGEPDVEPEAVNF